ncbi:enoyl-CoA hydratase/isomerase family protein [Ramlibacter sp.]|uniref:enoyl-CoA hydratase/isomerase family protein n=1 Tax=Ramlibacter sp. TaxID=1917967 RepID=UPI003D0CBD57
MHSEPPGLHREGAAAVIRLRRPREHNRLDPDDLDVIRRHLDTVLDEGEARALVLTGTGEQTFSSGYTIQAIVQTLDGRFEKLLDVVEDFPLPTICALNGSVYGGATDLALCCDFRIGVRGSRMFMPAAKFGLHYYPGGLRRYTTQLGPTQAKRLFLTAQTIADEEMLRIGFLTELVDRDELAPTVSRYVEAIGACEPQAVRSMKRQMNAIAGNAPDAAAERDDYERSLRSEELARRVGAIA